MKRLLGVALALSVALNLLLAGWLLELGLNGCAEVADGKLGVLRRELKVGPFGSDRSLFTLPKGLRVRNASATGAGWFEPHRFRLVVTSEDPNLVDYASPLAQGVPQASELYSADGKK